MLRRIQLRNFKGARQLDLRIADLTVLSGLNSAGKSTILQSICLLKQSFTGNPQSTFIYLSGPLVNLGNFSDLVTHNADDDQVEVSISSDGGVWTVAFAADGDANVAAVVEQRGTMPSSLESPRFQLLSAERVAPMVRFPRAPGEESVAGPLGSAGEFVADRLASALIANERVGAERGLSRDIADESNPATAKVAQTDLVLDQVSGWLQKFSPGVRLTSERIGGTDDVRLSFEYVGRKGIEETGARIRPTNVGFGLTYALPIIVAALTAPTGGLLLIENPEAHLHPRGQSQLAILISRAVASGVQVIVETHSDHFLNGVRLAVKGDLLNAEKIVLHYFSREMDTGDVFVQSPALLDDGSVPVWPDGFFDEWDKALTELLRG